MTANAYISKKKLHPILIISTKYNPIRIGEALIKYLFLKKYYQDN